MGSTSAPQLCCSKCWVHLFQCEISWGSAAPAEVWACRVQASVAPFCPILEMQPVYMRDVLLYLFIRELELSSIVDVLCLKRSCIGPEGCYCSLAGSMYLILWFVQCSEGVQRIWKRALRSRWKVCRQETSGTCTSCPKQATTLPTVQSFPKQFQLLPTTGLMR